MLPHKKKEGIEIRSLLFNKEVREPRTSLWQINNLTHH